ncbi:MAG TPA: cytochrome c oxidase assembly protein [Chromatiaceae bacterium]|jgi:cytochrome c oxidase assembly protein subunit 11|nr:cytochrome c oxidase assembly protein [Chromatiaceae bacterium]HIB83193.1 cytochrome c oxidase assembly protein [Chromatiaceae bacterium]HIN82217.1 cytochrome c oxidase assembly protein [Chromatiales bacterium]HIO15192.1 cytochrome c oxidase assembly protein [Chromatiales bacterium]HIO54778.1 cytochrome c oxidase assembly protein [Chromatiales bacterium]
MLGSELDTANRRVVKRLGVVVLAMFGFGFALVPLYDAICDLTGLNGKTGQVDEQIAKAYAVDMDRWITVEFVAQVNTELPWMVEPVVRTMRVHPGALTDALFVAQNRKAEQIVGQAIPSLVPNIASRYFDKTECFCFNQQTLGPKERLEMPLRFVIDPAIPKDVGSVVLSYTFFRVDGAAQISQAGS